MKFSPDYPPETVASIISKIKLALGPFGLLTKVGLSDEADRDQRGLSRS